MATLSVHSYSPRKRAISSSYHATEADLQLYRRLTLDLGVPPNSEMLRYVGPQADHLVFIGESGTSEWARFLRQVSRRWPDLPVGGPVAEDGTVLDSLPERLAITSRSSWVRRVSTMARSRQNSDDGTVARV